MIDPSSIDLDDLLTRWLGAPAPATRPQPSQAEQSFPLPSALLRWYVLASQWPVLASGGHRVYEAGAIREEDGMAIFMEDSTADWFWAFDSVSGELIFESPRNGAWESVPESMTELIRHLALIEIIPSVYPGKLCTKIAANPLARVLDPLTQVAFGGWRWPGSGHKVYIGESLLAYVGSSIAPGYSSVRIVAIDDDALSYLDDIPGVSWISLEEDPGEELA